MPAGAGRRPAPFRDAWDVAGQERGRPRTDHRTLRGSRRPTARPSVGYRVSIRAGIGALPPAVSSYEVDKDMPIPAAVSMKDLPWSPRHGRLRRAWAGAHK